MRRNNLKKAVQYALALGSTLWLVSCDLSDDRIQDTSDIREELNNRKLKKITEGEIYTAVSEAGSFIVAQSTDSLKSHLTGAIEKEGITGAMKYCSMEALNLTSRLSERYDVDITRYTTKPRNSQNMVPEGIEKTILEAYELSAASGNDVAPHIEIQQEDILYMQPIMVQPLCLKCHGELGVDINDESSTTLSSLYSEDNATGYKLGELRGMWRVKFDKKEFIKNMK